MDSVSAPQKTKTVFEQEFEKLATRFRNKEINKDAFKKEIGLLVSKAFVDIVSLQFISESKASMAGYIGLNVMDAIKAADNNLDNKVMIILNQGTQEQEELKLSEKERSYILEVGRFKPARAFYELIKIYKARGEQSPYHAKGDLEIYSYKANDIDMLLTWLEFTSYSDISIEEISEKLFGSVSDKGVDEIIDFEDIGVNIQDYDKERLSTYLTAMKSSIKEMRGNVDKIIDLIGSDNKWKGYNWKSVCKTCAATLFISLGGIAGRSAGAALIYVEAASIPVGIAVAVSCLILGKSMHEMLGAHGSTSHIKQKDVIEQISNIENKVKVISNMIHTDETPTIDELYAEDTKHRDLVTPGDLTLGIEKGK